tara:strand:+ start:43 stop:288 length:246 start_codon:yes stop_codon:yes gene_type:complete
MKPGDLVRYIERRKRQNSYVLPSNERPVGIIISVEEKTIYNDEGPEALMRTVRVKWSIDTWNNDSGLSEECYTDLEVIQNI